MRHDTQKDRARLEVTQIQIGTATDQKGDSGEGQRGGNAVEHAPMDCVLGKQFCDPVPNQQVERAGRQHQLLVGKPQLLKPVDQQHRHHRGGKTHRFAQGPARTTVQIGQHPRNTAEAAGHQSRIPRHANRHPGSRVSDTANAAGTHVHFKTGHRPFLLVPPHCQEFEGHVGLSRSVEHKCEYPKNVRRAHARRHGLYRIGPQEARENQRCWQCWQCQRCYQCWRCWRQGAVLEQVYYSHRDRDRDRKPLHPNHSPFR